MVTAKGIQTYVRFEKVHSRSTTEDHCTAETCMALIPKNEDKGCHGYDAEGMGCHTSCHREPKSRILIITAFTVLVLWAERIDYNWEFKFKKSNLTMT